MEIRSLAKEAIIISSDATFREAVALMVRKQTNSLLVTNGDGELVGEINVSDLLDAIVPIDVTADDIEEKLGSETAFGNAVMAASDLSVQDFMNSNIQPVHVDDSLIAIAGKGIAYQTAHLPIVDHDEHPIGIISRRGLKHILAKYLNITDTK